MTQEKGDEMDKVDNGTNGIPREGWIGRGPSEEWRCDKLQGKLDVTRRQIGVQLCKILKLDPATVKDMHLHLPIGGLATVTLERCINHDEAGEIVKMLESYTLGPKVEHPEAVGKS